MCWGKGYCCAAARPLPSSSCLPCPALPFNSPSSLPPSLSLFSLPLSLILLPSLPLSLARSFPFRFTLTVPALRLPGLGLS
ncbi:hypothetical protein ASPTUDRAFT_576146 [Aspergillus tubingensis CBS 134.48]|uniref:Uncharacterized protein n=1 Tax=Aspergillus tubingensis (strain CBS 134.48) TaxID=767770 RepID=A0A1L9N8H1_ASPTC|nr:hypothetical protein ASPTUDRAFT_576146 [Aspergillus tubingensis CBS 134.48]